MLRTITFLVLLTSLAMLFANHEPLTYEQKEVWRDYHTRADSAHNFDVQTYDLDITIDDAQEWISATCTATIINEVGITEMQFELEQLTVNAVRIDGTPTTYVYDDHVITIDLPYLPTGQPYEIAIDYEGNPTLSNDAYHLGMFFMGSYVFTLSDPSGARWWMPTYDHPWDKAEIDFTVTMRDDWVVACNGLRTGIVDNGDGTHTTTWDGQNPMPPHLFVIHAGPFLEIEQSHNDLPILNFSPQSYYANSVEDFSNLPFMIETFEELYGPYPWEKYGNVVLGMQTFGAMEHQTMTTMGSSLIDGQHGGERTIAHELAHQWYGNCLTPLTWKDVWLSEGFAVYSEALYTDAWLGWDEAVDYVRHNIMNYYKNWAGGQPHTIYDPEFNDFFSPPQYEKAASVLHMLRLEVGDDAFFDILQTWFTTYHGGWVVTQEFVEMCEQVSGQELSWFFDQWIYGEGIPSVDYAFFWREGDISQFRCYVQTSGNGDTDFTLHIPVVFYQDNGDSEAVLVEASPGEEINEYQTTESYWAYKEIDPESWVLARYHEEHLPELQGAYASDGAVMLQWLPFMPELNLGYNIWRGSSGGELFTQINDEPVMATSYLDEGLTNGDTYTYLIQATLDDEWVTHSSDTLTATPMVFPLDRGVLLVDETIDGNGATPISPTNAMVDEYYSQVVNSLYRQWDYAVEGAPPIDTLACYSTVLWVDDDVSQHRIEDNQQTLGAYVLGGGNLVVSGWKTAQELPSDFMTAFLGEPTAQMWTQPWCTGASSDDYPDLQVDANKMIAPWSDHLAYACTFPDASEGMYVFNGENEPVGQPCALKSTPGGAFVMLGFPLYFMQQDGVTALLDQLLTEFGEELSTTPTPQPEMTLAMWPNPLRTGGAPLSVRFSLPEQSDVEATVYNIRGQRVATLVRDTLPAGAHSLTWDKRNTNGQAVSSGVYLLHVKHSAGAQTHKVLLLR